MTDLFNLAGRVTVITGGAGLLGMKHAEVIAAHGSSPVLVDIADARAQARDLEERFGVPAMACRTDITNPSAVRGLLDEVLARFQRVDILINNAANNPKVGESGSVNFSRLENFPLEQWNARFSAPTWPRRSANMGGAASFSMWRQTWP
jgi:NAD(P)-dependent dehydrogenase (short-subunit alcohol dehydrogenase family)